MHYISLGYFCSVAMELGELGLRRESAPFDWLISDFKGVIEAIENRFDGLLAYDHLLQSNGNHAHYKNIRYGFEFYHDFNQLRPLSEQLPAVQAKFDRRIARFYETIQEPTLFIRYISDEVLIGGRSAELCWTEENYGRITALLKSFNAENEILFIANSGVTSQIIPIYHVEKDRDDTVCRRPIFSCPDLLARLESAACENKEVNKEFYQKSQSGSRLRKIRRKLFSILTRTLKMDYIHPGQY